MRITLTTDGGLAFLPGLAGPTTLDVDGLDAGARADLRRLIGEARFFNVPEPGPVGRGADRREHTLTIECDGRARTLRLGEPIGDPALRELVRRVRDLARDGLPARPSPRRDPA